MPKGDIIGRTVPLVGLMDEIAIHDRPYNHIEFVSLADQTQPEKVIAKRVDDAVKARETTREVVILVETAVDTARMLLTMMTTSFGLW